MAAAMGYRPGRLSFDHSPHGGNICTKQSSCTQRFLEIVMCTIFSFGDDRPIPRAAAADQINQTHTEFTKGGAYLSISQHYHENGV
jgi:hypothetical protein